MHAFQQYRDMPASFWALVKFISQELRYTNPRTKSVRTYTEEEICALLRSRKIIVPHDLICEAAMYAHLRAGVLNDVIRPNLMNATTAREEFERLFPIYQENNFTCNLPMNKQKGEMKQIAYFTAIINILTEKTIRETTNSEDTKLFNDDPRSLIYVLDENRNLVGASSRRLDGAYPDVINPEIVWEIKEYYYTTTFGSRVADGVYETQLDGFEFKDISKRTNRPIKHVLFIDGYKTWWEDGKSYLCRIFDALNSGLVDEVIAGREVLTRWPALLKELL